MPNPTFREVQPEPLSNVALKVMREAIVNGELAPGQSIKQAEVAKQLGISRAPLREALRQLETEGLVVNVPFHGAIVTPMTVDDLEELQSFRRVIELFAAEQMLSRCADRDFDMLDSIINEMERHAETGDWDALNAADIQFHTQVIQLSGHRLLATVWQRYAQPIRRMLTLRHRLNRDPYSLVLMHRELMEAFRARDFLVVRQRYAAHGADLVAALANLLQQEGLAARTATNERGSAREAAGTRGATR